MDVKRIAFARGNTASGSAVSRNAIRGNAVSSSAARGFAAFGLALSAALAAAPALAQAPKNASQLGIFKEWGVYTASVPKGKTCFVGAKPTESELDPKPKQASRDPVYLFVTTRPAEKVRNEVSVRSGYTHKEGSDVTAEIGKEKFTLFVNGDGAWVKEPADETRLINAMRKGAKLVVKGVSKRGTHTTDTYALAGFAQAMDRMAQAKECR